MDHYLVSTVLVLLLGLSQARFLRGPTNAEDAQPGVSSDITTVIFEANQGISHMLLEGDILIPRSRNAMKCLNNYCNWPKSPSGLVEVPYKVHSSFASSEKTLILSAMQSFAMKTCIRFIPYNNQSNHISIVNQDGCWSAVGKVGGAQHLSLSVHGCVRHGVIEHELIHSLGFYHEHSRSDRDQYVKINWNNIPSVDAHNFQKQDTNNLNTTNDYTSVMHYGRTFFSSNGHDTINPIPNSSVVIGQRIEMSTIDVQRINKLYRCSV